MKTPQQLMHDNCIVKHYAGSKAYGTSLPTSDTDFRGVFVADPVNVRTPFYPIREVEDSTEEDTKLYELAQFMKLCLDCNPNVIETLWVDEQSIIHQTPAYRLLRDNAAGLLSSKIAFTTTGYALAQLKRIKGHNKWINNPQAEAAPQQADYVSLVHNFTTAQIFKVDLRNYTLNHRLVPFSGDTYGLYQVNGYTPYNGTTGSLNVDYEGDTHTLGVPKFLLKYNRAVYEHDKEVWSNYWTWKKNRNVTRSALEEQFGFDTKHAMHLVRLLRMGAEALEHGTLQVYRQDADELLQIRAGAWSYEQLVEYAEEMEFKVREVLVKTTSLPKKPNIALAAKLTLEVQDLVWSQNGQ